MFRPGHDGIAAIRDSEWQSAGRATSRQYPATLALLSINGTAVTHALTMQTWQLSGMCGHCRCGQAKSLAEAVSRDGCAAGRIPLLSVLLVVAVLSYTVAIGQWIPVTAVYQAGFVQAATLVLRRNSTDGFAHPQFVEALDSVVGAVDRFVGAACGPSQVWEGSQLPVCEISVESSQRELPTTSQQQNGEIWGPSKEEAFVIRSQAAAEAFLETSFKRTNQTGKRFVQSLQRLSMTFPVIDKACGREKYGLQWKTSLSIVNAGAGSMCFQYSTGIDQRAEFNNTSAGVSESLSDGDGSHPWSEARVAMVLAAGCAVFAALLLVLRLCLVLRIIGGGVITGIPRDAGAVRRGVALLVLPPADIVALAATSLISVAAGDAAVHGIACGGAFPPNPWVAGAGMACGWLSLLGLARHRPTCGAAQRTMAVGTRSLSGFVVGALPLFTAFLFSAAVLLGDVSERFSSLMLTGQTLFAVVNGDVMRDTFLSASQLQPSLAEHLLAIAFMFAFVLLMLFIVLTSCVALLEEAYVLARPQGAVPGPEASPPRAMTSSVASATDRWSARLDPCHPGVSEIRGRLLNQALLSAPAPWYMS